MPQTLAGRLVPAVAIALFVSLGLGVALAAGDGVAEDAASITVPAARIGDRASYDVTLEGAWRYDDYQAGQPFPFFSFEWRSGGLVPDREGRAVETDLVRVEGLGYNPMNMQLG